ncbi:hypothetical protein LAZ67_5000503 [Cordylochernes scorpioides]|uniref:DNA-directed DNA polymerase n=1 Tax=Cordylochernes scorpioides TaxID=51811 RepID=A0ABY6KF65_9ARAC|nr:hypothetical protein LAZ67_5000503 [Cordylochernes scorpioides]
MKSIMISENINSVLSENKEEIDGEISLNPDRGSVWMLKEIIYCDLYINKYKALKGSSYIDLPKEIKDKKAVINIKNDDNKCFLWSILAALHPIEKNPQRVSKYKKYENQFGDNEYPMKLENIGKFEKKHNLSINVFSYDNKFKIYPLLISKNKSENNIDLLYIKNEKNDHYCLIRDLDRLLSSQDSKHTEKKYHCRRCLNYFGRKDLLEKHSFYCNEALRAEFPQEKYVEFKNYQRKMKIPFAIYADFESILPKVESCISNPENSYTNEYQKHKPSGFNYYKTYGENKSKPVSYRGEDADKLTNEDRQNYKTTKVCHICEKEFKKGDIKVRDHCHLTGKFNGAAHDKCNVNYRIPKFVPIFFHNLQKYDAHLFIKALADRGGDLKVISKTEQNYISFSSKITVGEYKDKNDVLKPIKYDMRFLDSFSFLSSSLDNLSKTLKHFPHLEHNFPKDKISLITRKLPYCYDYIDSFDKFKEETIPPKRNFVKTLWKEFNIKNLGEFHDLYVKIDTLLLADIFENFRNICMKIYKLDPCYYFTAPGLSWDAMLKHTKVKLEIIKDYDMILMIEKGIRGGINQVSKRYVKAQIINIWKIMIKIRKVTI